MAFLIYNISKWINDGIPKYSTLVLTKIDSNMIKVNQINCLLY